MISSCAISWKWTVHPKMAIVLQMTFCSISVVFFFCLFVNSWSCYFCWSINVAGCNKIPWKCLTASTNIAGICCFIQGVNHILLVLLYSYDIGLACTWYYINCLYYYIFLYHCILSILLFGCLLVRKVFYLGVILFLTWMGYHCRWKQRLS